MQNLKNESENSARVAPRVPKPNEFTRNVAITSSPSRLPVGHNRSKSTNIMARTATSGLNDTSMAPPPRPKSYVKPTDSAPRTQAASLSKGQKSSSSARRELSSDLKSSFTHTSRRSVSSNSSRGSGSSDRRNTSKTISTTEHSRRVPPSAINVITRSPLPVEDSTHAQTTSRDQLKSAIALKPPIGSSLFLPPTITQHSTSLRQSSNSSRPGFSTLQQHFSPARNLAPKPLSSSFLAPPSPSKLPANVVIASDIAKLQAELLQLHLLHRDSHKVGRAYEESAQKQLEDLLRTLDKQDNLLRVEESARYRRRALIALRNWEGVSTSKDDLTDKIQALDSVVAEVILLNEPSSSFQNCIRIFENYMVHVQEIREHRTQGELQEIDTYLFDESWASECRNLLQSAIITCTTAKALGQLNDNSTLARLLSICQTSMDNVVTQIQVMLKMRSEVEASEREWITRMCNEDSDDDGSRGREVGSAWRN